MTETQIVEAVKSAFDDIDTSNFHIETNFKDNDEWSSLTVLSLITILDDSFGKTISGEELGRIDTIKDLYDQIK